MWRLRRTLPLSSGRAEDGFAPSFRAKQPLTCAASHYLPVKGYYRGGRHSSKLFSTLRQNLFLNSAAAILLFIMSRVRKLEKEVFLLDRLAEQRITESIYAVLE